MYAIRSYYDPDKNARKKAADSLNREWDKAIADHKKAKKATKVAAGKKMAEEWSKVQKLDDAWVDEFYKSEQSFLSYHRRNKA